MPNEEKKQKKDKLVQVISIVICFLALATPLTCSYFNSKKYDEMLTHNFTIVSGVITGFKNQYKHSIAFVYNFNLNDTAYTWASSGNQNDYGTLIRHSDVLVGKSFPVIVNKEKPEEYSKLLITPDDFEDYNIVFPDSLDFERKIVDN